MNIRDTQSSINKKRIIDAAIIEFGENGYANASTNRICSAAKVSKGLLFHYFGTKDQLFAEVFCRCMEDIKKVTTAESNSVVFHKLNYIDFFYRQRLLFFSQNPYHYNILTGLFPGHLEQLQKICKKKHAEILADKEKILRLFLDDYRLKEEIDPDCAMELIASVSDHIQSKYIERIIHSKVSESQIEEFAENFQKEHHEMLMMIFKGIVR